MTSEEDKSIAAETRFFEASVLTGREAVSPDIFKLGAVMFPVELTEARTVPEEFLHSSRPPEPSGLQIRVPRTHVGALQGKRQPLLRAAGGVSGTLARGMQRRYHQCHHDIDA